MQYQPFILYYIEEVEENSCLSYIEEVEENGINVLCKPKIFLCWVTSFQDTFVLYFPNSNMWSIHKYHDFIAYFIYSFEADYVVQRMGC